MERDDPIVRRLSASEMDARIGERRPVLVLFYADWCGFCIGFLRPWAERVRGMPLEAVAADISDWDDPRWEVHRIEAVPTVVLFEGGTETARLASPLGVGLDASELDAFLARLARYPSS